MGLGRRAQQSMGVSVIYGFGCLLFDSVDLSFASGTGVMLIDWLIGSFLILFLWWKLSVLCTWIVIPMVKKNRGYFIWSLSYVAMTGWDLPYIFFLSLGVRWFGWWLGIFFRVSSWKKWKETSFSVVCLFKGLSSEVFIQKDGLCQVRKDVRTNKQIKVLR